MREVLPRKGANTRSFFGGLKKKFLSVVNIEDSVVRIPEDFNLKQERPMVISIDTDRNLKKEPPALKQMQVQALPSVDIRNSLKIQCMPSLSIPSVDAIQSSSFINANGKNVKCMANVGFVVYKHQEILSKLKEEFRKSSTNGQLVMDDANRGFIKVC